MPVKPATPQDTFDHVFGSGATSWEWYRRVKGLNVDMASIEPVPADWQVEVKCETGEEDPAFKTVIVTHALIMKWARKVAGNEVPEKTLHPNSVCARAIRDLVFDADEADLDACSGDALLQLAVLEDIVFG